MKYKLITYNNELLELIKELISFERPINLINKQLIIESIEDDLFELFKAKSIGVLKEGIVVENMPEASSIIDVMAKIIFKHLLTKSSAELVLTDLTNDNEIFTF